MALVGPYRARIDMVDEHGLKASKIFEMLVDDVIFPGENAQIAAVQAKMAQVAQALDAITDLQITSVVVLWDTTPLISGLKSAPADQGAAEGAIVKVYKQDSDILHPYWIPGAKAGVFLSDFRTVDTGDGQLQDFFAEYEDTAATPLLLSDGERLDTGRGNNGLLSGYYSTRARTTA